MDQTPEGEEGPRIVQAVERARKLWAQDGETIASKARKACKDYGADQVLKALTIAEIKSSGQPHPVGWGYVINTLKTGKDEDGLIVPPAARRFLQPSTFYDQGAERQRLLKQVLINSGRADS